MVTTLRTHIRSRDSRRFFGTYLAGKMLGLGLLLLAVWGVTWYFSTKAGAAVVGQAAPKLAGDDIVNPLNTMWVLVTAFLVFFMQAGFMMLEAGFARTREISNIMLECIADTCLCGLLFWAFGFAFMFGTGNGLIGHEFFFLNNAPATYGSTGVAFLAFFLFQFAFADTCSTITSGAMVGRTAFGGDLLYSIGVSGFIYPILGHWVWGPDGWLATWNTPFRDFAGSTVVHTIGGMIALAGAIALGPRLGRKFKRDGGGMPPGHDMTIAARRWRDPVVRLVRVQPRQHAVGDGLRRYRPGRGQHDARGVCRRSVDRCSSSIRSASGIRASRSTASSPVSSRSRVRVIGCHRSVRSASVRSPAWSCMLGIDFLEWLRIDDPIGAVAVHGFCGIWGTISLGLVRHRPVRPADADGRRHLDAGRGAVLRRWREAARQSRSLGSAIVTVVDVRRRAGR